MSKISFQGYMVQVGDKWNPLMLSVEEQTNRIARRYTVSYERRKYCVIYDIANVRFVVMPNNHKVQKYFTSLSQNEKDQIASNVVGSLLDYLGITDVH